MIHAVWPTLASMLLATGILAALQRRFGWRFSSVPPPIAYRAARPAVGLPGVARLPRLAASHCRSLSSVGILPSLRLHLGIGSGLLMTFVFSTPASV